MAALTKLTTNINLEMSGDTKRYLVSAKQGDKATRFIVAKLLNNGEPYTIPTGSRAVINIAKPDGKHVYNNLDCDGETPYLRTVTPIFIDGATPQVRRANEGVDFDGGTPTSRQLAV